MGCFRISLNALEIIFYALSLVQAYRAWRLARVIGAGWQNFKKNPLTRRQAALADGAAFYLAVPPAVLIHELFHAIPIWAFGGRVVRCGYGFYWGFVQPNQAFPATEEWFISLAGTLGSLGFGLVLWLLLRRHRSRALRFFALRALRFQVYFSLIFYPVFTAVTFIGDWRIIYDFPATPVLSAATAVVHAALLGFFWWADRRGRFEMVAHETAAGQQQFETLKEALALNPNDSQRRLQYIDALRQGGAKNRAKVQLNRFLEQNPNSAQGYLQLAALQSEGGNNISTAAVKNAQKALDLGLSNGRRLLFVHQLLGRHHLNRGDDQKAVAHLSDALTLSEKIDQQRGDVVYQAQLHYWRSQAYRRQRRHEMAYQDMQQAVTLAQSAGAGKMAERYRSELHLLEKQTGRSQP